MVKPEAQPHGRRGWLKNDNPPADLANVTRCGAKTRRQTACLSPAMKNGRCRMHGGASTGPRTAEGKERTRRAAITHGYYTREAREARAQARTLRGEFAALVRELFP